MWLTALIMGFAGSLHCAGMCSPLAMTIVNVKSPAFINRILYNSGRILVYGILGAMVASIGYMLPLAKFQNILSIVFGLALLMLAAIGITGVQIPFFTRIIVKFTGTLKKVFSRFIYNKNTGSIILLGALNGLLPCGLTFLALSFCVMLAGPVDGFLYMFVFGIGTLPVMLGIGSIVSFISNKLNWNVRHIITGLLVLSGILLIARVFIVHLPDEHTHTLELVDIIVCH